jgi:3-methyladenine DNA glycosylase/8-oxoguanine DNA glycosylase
MALNGWIILDKPVGLGSTQAVGAVKRALREAGEPFRPYRSFVALYCWHAVHIARGQIVLPAATEG